MMHVILRDPHAQVRTLEGRLADFNLALDKLRTNTDITEIKDTHDQLKFDNERVNNYSHSAAGPMRRALMN